MPSKTDILRKSMKSYNRQCPRGGSPNWSYLRARECELLKSAVQLDPEIQQNFGPAVEYVLHNREDGFDKHMQFSPNTLEALPESFKQRVRPTGNGGGSATTPPPEKVEIEGDEWYALAMEKAAAETAGMGSIEAMEHTSRIIASAMQVAKAEAEAARKKAEAEAEAQAAREAAAAAAAAENNVFARAKKLVAEAEKDGRISNPHSQLPEALACVMLFGRAYLAGPSGTGKTVATEQLAAILNREHVLVSCEGDASKFDLLGSKTAHGDWSDGPVGDAWRDGKVCLLDELDKTPPHAACSLNAVVNFNDSIHLDDQTPRHEDFVCIATGNSAMDGPSNAYATERQSADFVARWEQLGVMVHFDYCPKVEKQILGQYASEHKLLAKARKNLKSEQIDDRRTIQCRTMEGWKQWRSNGCSIGETVGRICRLWQETEVRKVWSHLGERDINEALAMIGSW